MPRREAGLLKLVIGIVVLVVLAGGGAIYWFVIRSESPPKFSLGSGCGGGTSPSGTWRVEGNGRSQVGYRVREQFVGVPAPSDAVGRTKAIQGRMTIDGTTVRSVEVSADLRQLHSDKSRRDNKLRTHGLETDRFPTASFRLRDPITLGPVSGGAKIHATATGDLTLHGVTRTVSIPLEACAKGGRVEVITSPPLPVAFSEWSIDPPSIGGFVTVQDHGAMELDLSFVRG